MPSATQQQLVGVCLRCGGQAAPHGEHHAVERGDGTTGAKGMGGSKLDHEHERIALCRACHEATHQSVFSIRRVKLNGYAFIECYDGDKTLSRRAVTEIDIAPSELPNEPARIAAELARASDNSLATIWGYSGFLGARLIVIEALVAREYAMRYGAYGDRWYTRVAEMIRDTTGMPVAVGTVYNRAMLGNGLMLVEGDRIEAMVNLGHQLLIEVGKQGTAEALEYAETQRAEGRRMTAIAKELRGTNGAKPPKCDTTGEHVCRYCGARV